VSLVDSSNLRRTLLISRVFNSQVDEMIREADVNGDGIIDYKEFTKIILN
jgi:calmodulin